jgi:hypothetical protein
VAKLFLSYNRASAAVADALVQDLEALDHVVWFDQELSGGQAWWTQILARLRDCDGFLILLNEDSLSSVACQRELAYATSLGKTIIPVRVDDVSIATLPAHLAQLQLIDYRANDRAAALRLARAVSKVLPSPLLPDPLPAAPDVPLSYLGTIAERVESSSALSYEQQTSLFFDLTQSLRDPDVAKDALRLVERFRQRHDLYAKVAAEIDALLRSAPPPRPDTRPPASPNKPAAAAPASRAGYASEGRPDLRPKKGFLRAIPMGDELSKNLVAGLIYAGCGLIVGMVMFSSSGMSTEDVAFASVQISAFCFVAGFLLGLPWVFAALAGSITTGSIAWALMHREAGAGWFAGCAFFLIPVFLLVRVFRFFALTPKSVSTSPD